MRQNSTYSSTVCAVMSQRECITDIDQEAYYIANIDGKDIIQAESWIKKHRSHRGLSGTMDDKLYKLYFLYGVDNDEHINDDELALDDNMIEYMNDIITHDDEVETWLNILDNYQRSGRITVSEMIYVILLKFTSCFDSGNNSVFEKSSKPNLLLGPNCGMQLQQKHFLF